MFFLSSPYPCVPALPIICAVRQGTHMDATRKKGSPGNSMKSRNLENAEFRDHKNMNSAVEKQERNSLVRHPFLPVDLAILGAIHTQASRVIQMNRCHDEVLSFNARENARYILASVMHLALLYLYGSAQETKRSYQ